MCGTEGTSVGDREWGSEGVKTVMGVAEEATAEHI
jgi:hypothetical protein